MAKKKNKKTNKKSFFFGSSEKKKTSKKSKDGNGLAAMVTILKVLILVSILGGIAVGFVYLDRYAKRVEPVSAKTANLVLKNAPGWVNEHLKDKISAAARANGEDLKLDDDVAASVHHNLETLVSWLSNIKVRTTSDSLIIDAQWRKPIVLIEYGREKFYVAGDLTILDYVPMPNLPVISVEGFSKINKSPRPGEKWLREDIAAAIAILVKFDNMDKIVTPDKPLLFELDKIDISNFNGRQSGNRPHILLYADDGTKIIWGAEIGTWQRYMEAPDDEKLAKLYEYYKQFGTIQHGVKFINLRDPQDKIFQPVDKYSR